MRNWSDLTFETKALLNPAFCGELVLNAAKAYQKEKGTGVPYAASYLILPIVLHAQSRFLIGERNRKAMHVWLQQHQEARIGFAERARSLVPISRRASLFLLQTGYLQLTDDVRLIAIKRRRKTFTFSGTENKGFLEIQDCISKSKTVGRWFARAGKQANIFTMWGVKP